MTALHYAIQKGFTECATLLQRYSASSALQSQVLLATTFNDALFIFNVFSVSGQHF
jgi:hypothetical protein